MERVATLTSGQCIVSFVAREGIAPGGSDHVLEADDNKFAVGGIIAGGSRIQIDVDFGRP